MVTTQVVVHIRVSFIFEGDNDVYDFFITHIINKYEKIFLCKTSQRTSMLSGIQLVRDMIDSHP